MKTDAISIASLTEQVLKSNSFSELCRYYHLADNGKYRGHLRNLISKNGLSISHWDWHKSQRKYPFIEKECPVCHDKFSTQFGHRDEKTVCSTGCSNIYFSTIRHTDKSNKKTSDSIKKYRLSVGKHNIKYKIKCQICGKEKETKKKTQTCCSNKCAAKLRSSNPKYIQKLKDGMVRRIADGRHNGWASRNILSYPEKFFITVLNNKGINYVANKPCGGYFLDFALNDKMIDLEIDGKQHMYPDRKESDTTRDDFLTKNGWNVYRIKWNSINTEAGRAEMKMKIDGFISFYNSIKSCTPLTNDV